MAAVSMISPHSRSALMARLRIISCSGLDAFGCRRPEFRAGTEILLRTRHLGAQHYRRVPAPTWIVEHAPRQPHHISLGLGNDCLGLRRRRDQPDHARGDTDLALDPL